MKPRLSQLAAIKAFDTTPETKDQKLQRTTEQQRFLQMALLANRGGFSGLESQKGVSASPQAQSDQPLASGVPDRLKTYYKRNAVKNIALAKEYKEFKKAQKINKGLKLAGLAIAPQALLNL